MAFVVTENCIDCRYTRCAAVCPVEAFRAGPDRLYIDPVACIDCNACVPECPVGAIYGEDAVPPQWKDAIARNRTESSKHPPITETRTALRGPRCVNPDAG
ncbi:4Fe-4S binding protein [Opitutales bacterium ASA1]|uniref:indolepyruvate ferredoxin oxidoreductase subunit alpha n=1 Tax=Congregicoccus parvus TaxID=3081749 RepID=UPI002B319BE5|nr:4Fe-4S binding protein [Opitutales bacterium ASA1]